MLVRAGSGVYRDRSGEVPLGPGSLVRLVPGRPHWYGVVGAGRWDEVYLTFTGPLFDTAARQGRLFDPPVTRVRPVDRWGARLDAHRTRTPPLTVGGADREATEVLRALVDAADPGAADASSEPVGADWLARSQSLLGHDLGEDLDLASVATAVGLTYETWRKRFRQATGLSPGRYRAMRRVDAAAEALRRSTLSHREIAASLGFSDAPHLARQLRALHGTTPSDVRRRG